MIPLVPSKRLAEAEQDSDDSEIWEQVTDEPSAQESGAMPLEQAQIIIRGTKKRSGATKEQKMERLRLHQVHLVTLLASVITRNKWCNDGIRSMLMIELLQSICYSMISKPISKTRLFKHSMKTFLNHWKGMIKLDIKDRHHVIDSCDHLVECLSERCMDSRNNYNLVFSAACRSIHLNTRLMACFFPVSLSLAKDEGEEQALQIWLEVWDDFHEIWIPVDAAKNVVDEPLKIIEYGQGRKSWGIYVLAFDSSKYSGLNFSIWHKRCYAEIYSRMGI